MRKLLVEFVKRNRQMFEPLITAETFDQHINQMACAGVWGSHIELQAAASLFQAAASLFQMPVFLCTSSQPEQDYKWICYNPFSSEKLISPPLQERPKTPDLLNHIELCHTGSLSIWNFHSFHTSYISNIHITTIFYVNWLFIYTCIYTVHP